MVNFDPEVLQRVGALCRQFHVVRLDLTGSAARGDFDLARSDVDLLVEFEPMADVTALSFIELADALEAVFGRRVDLIEPTAVTNPILREAFLRDRVPFYAAA